MKPAPPPLSDSSPPVSSSQSLVPSSSMSSEDAKELCLSLQALAQKVQHLLGDPLEPAHPFVPLPNPGSNSEATLVEENRRMAEHIRAMENCHERFKRGMGEVHRLLLCQASALAQGEVLPATSDVEAEQRARVEELSAQLRNITAQYKKEQELSAKRAAVISKLEKRWRQLQETARRKKRESKQKAHDSSAPS